MGNRLIKFHFFISDLFCLLFLFDVILKEECWWRNYNIAGVDNEEKKDLAIAWWYVFLTVYNWIYIYVTKFQFPFQPDCEI